MVILGDHSESSMQVRTLKEVLLIAQAVGASLEDADLVVETFDEVERDPVLGSAVGGDAVPVTVDHVGLRRCDLRLARTTHAGRVINVREIGNELTPAVTRDRRLPLQNRTSYEHQKCRPSR